MLFNLYSLLQKRSGYNFRPQPKKPLAEAPTLSQMSDFPDEPLDLSQTLEEQLSLSQEPVQMVLLPGAEVEARKEGIKELFRQIAQQSNIGHFFFTENFQSLKPETKRQRIAAMRQIIETLFQLMDPTNPGQLWQLVMSRPQSTKWTNAQTFARLDKLLDAISRFYSQSTHKMDQIHALALAAPFVSFGELENYIPGLKKHYYTESQRIFARYGYAAQVKPRKQERQRLGTGGLVKVENFVAFLTLPTNMVSLPFGIHKLKLKSGEVLEVPSVIRVMSKTRTINKYYKYLVETNTNDTYYLSRSTLERIMDACTAGVRKTTQGLDNYTFLGVEAVDLLTDLLTQSAEKFQLDRQWIDEQKTSLMEAKHYIKADFKMHLKKSSKVAKHCMSWALSDPNDQHFLHHENDHTHDYVCPHCSSVQTTIQEIKGELSAKDWPADELNEVLYQLDQADVDIQKWIAHQVRSAYQDSLKDEIIAHLKPRTVAFITVDW